MWATANIKMRSKRLAFIKCIGQMSPQGFRQKQRSDASHNRKRSHYNQWKYVAVVSL